MVNNTEFGSVNWQFVAVIWHVIGFGSCEAIHSRFIKYFLPRLNSYSHIEGWTYCSKLKQQSGLFSERDLLMFC